MPTIGKKVANTINFALYEDSVNYLGIASVTLPNLQYIVQSVSGAGIAGNVESVVMGHIDTMTMSMDWRQVTKAATTLSEPRMHLVDLRVARGYEDEVEAIFGTQKVKYLVEILPKGLNLGGVQPASAGDASGEYAVRSVQLFVDGERLLYIDAAKFIFEVNGTDYLAPVRAAMGQ